MSSVHLNRGPIPEFCLDFANAWGEPTHKALFRHDVEDFIVEEDLGFSPVGAGEHLLLHIRKRNQNTRWLAAALALQYGIDEVDVGYCGLKDRRSVASQWFSVCQPGGVGKPSMDIEGCELLAWGRHTRKLRPGMHLANTFVIKLHFGEGAREDIDQRLGQILEQGVPNYFGEQRFGIQGNNLAEVAYILAQPKPRFRGRRGGLYLSAARSWLFNLVLAERVKAGDWSSKIDVDGPLWGRGRSPAAPRIADLEKEILAPWQHWCHALEHSGLRMERRPLAMRPKGFAWQWCDKTLELRFSLPPGGYATAILRELALLTAPEPML